MKNLFIQGIKFIGISGIGWILDFCVFTLMGFFSANYNLNNIISSWIGVTFVFIFATRKVFKNNSRLPLRFKYIIYIFYQCILIFFISKLLGIINNIIVLNIGITLIKDLSFIFAKILVTPITMVLNFFVMKGVIEKI